MIASLIDPGSLPANQLRATDARHAPRVATNSPPSLRGLVSPWTWGAGLAVVYLAFCWLAWNRTLIPDEIWALTNAEQSLREQLESVRTDLVHPPLIYLVERAWIACFGLTDFTAKALPVVINVVALCLFPLLAVRVTKSWKIASILLLTVYLHVYAVPNLVRMYGLLLLLTIASLWAWDRWRRQPTASALLVWTAIMVLAVMTHYFGAMLLASYVVIAFVIGPRVKAIVSASCIPALLVVAWTAYVFPVYAAHGLRPNLAWVQPSLLLAMLVVPFHFLTTIPSGSNPVLSDWLASLPARPAMIAAAVALHVMLVALVVWRRRTASSERDWLVSLLAVTCLPALFLAVATRFVGPAFDSRFLAGMLPAYWLLIALLCDLAGRVGYLLLRFVIAPIALIAVLVPLPHDLAESPLRAAVARIADEHRPGDIVMGDRRIGPQAYWELRAAHLPLQWAMVPSAPYFTRFGAPPAIPDRAWVFCIRECNDSLRTMLSGHVMRERYGDYLALFERS
jgi:hypothetical protein